VHLQAGAFECQWISGILSERHHITSPEITGEGSKRHFHQWVLVHGACTDPNAAGDIVGEITGFEANIAPIQLVSPYSLQLWPHVHTYCAISMVEGIFQFPNQLLPFRLQISSHHIDWLLNEIWTVVQHCYDNFPGCLVSSGVRWQTVLYINENDNFCSFATLSAHGYQVWHLALFFRDDGSQELNELLLIIQMIGQYIEGTASVVVDSCCCTSATNNSVLAEWLCQSGRATSQLSQKLQ